MGKKSRLNAAASSSGGKKKGSNPDIPQSAPGLAIFTPLSSAPPTQESDERTKQFDSLLSEAYEQDSEKVIGGQIDTMRALVRSGLLENIADVPVGQQVPEELMKHVKVLVAATPQIDLANARLSATVTTSQNVETIPAMTPEVLPIGDNEHHGPDAKVAPIPPSVTPPDVTVISEVGDSTAADPNLSARNKQVIEQPSDVEEEGEESEDTSEDESTGFPANTSIMPAGVLGEGRWVPTKLAMAYNEIKERLESLPISNHADISKLGPLIITTTHGVKTITQYRALLLRILAAYYTRVEDTGFSESSVKLFYLVARLGPSSTSLEELGSLRVAYESLALHGWHYLVLLISDVLFPDAAMRNAEGFAGLPLTELKQAVSRLRSVYPDGYMLYLVVARALDMGIDSIMPIPFYLKYDVLLDEYLAHICEGEMSVNSLLLTCPIFTVTQPLVPYKETEVSRLGPDTSKKTVATPRSQIPFQPIDSRFLRPPSFIKTTSTPVEYQLTQAGQTSQPTITRETGLFVEGATNLSALTREMAEIRKFSQEERESRIELSSHVNALRADLTAQLKILGEINMSLATLVAQRSMGEFDLQATRNLTLLRSSMVGGSSSSGPNLATATSGVLGDRHGEIIRAPPAPPIPAPTLNSLADVIRALESGSGPWSKDLVNQVRSHLIKNGRPGAAPSITPVLLGDAEKRARLINVLKNFPTN